LCQSTVATTLICGLNHQESSDCTLCCRHWEYDLKHLNILNVDASDDGTSAVILAAIQVVLLSYSWYGAGTCSAVLGCAECRLTSCNYNLDLAWAIGKIMLTTSCFSLRLTVGLGLQEDASLFEDLALLHIYRGTYTAEYEAVHSRQGWKLISSNITL